MNNKLKIIHALKGSKFGLTITQLVNQIKLTRSDVRNCLAYMEGAKQIIFRNIGMAKVYVIKEDGTLIK